ncbi:MAG: hypothetical protein A2782_03215 [Candidatus Blackburnbacteria bacterium RIFCSPHIGHO2_01_FULL_43_15b]|uniref:Serine aminopeptidase S33 domain-containing protein n=1 Tax=Candidatus Blackburnbacteria bacterium RIFCSPHIGHO2_01_FULL_43_15b TaxID=1797513 RepID=A0A1G1V1E5_9BACT|nr:MAG: hypothetical protein A2782_03215 [Candidatus Blackburnbacteria bacterium RIFCSPHIGHO2_01_FULL_43_15b]
MENHLLNKNKKSPTLVGIPTKSGQFEDKHYMIGSAPIFIDKKSEVGALLLHSYTSTPYEMKEIASYLADKGITVYAPLIAGHGTTPDDLAKTTIAEWQESAEKAYFFIKEKVRKVFVIGSSFGGNLAFHLATKFNNPLAGVISMGTPIKVQWQKAFLAAMYTYGFFKKNQKKRRRDYHFTFEDIDQVVYPVMPVKSLRRLFYFFRKVTPSSLPKITAPTLIIQSSQEKIVNPDSAQYIHEKLASKNKRILWMNGSTHALTIAEKRNLIFNTVYHFISEN